MHWLLSQDVFDAMQSARVNHAPTVAELEAHEQTYALHDDDTPRIMSVAGDTAAIQITGVLTDRPDFFARFFGRGNTTYSEIIKSVALADMDPAVKTIQLTVNSPGGQATTGWLEAMQAVAGATKPVEALVGDMAASAAFGLVSQAGKITAQNSLSKVGSVGAATVMRISDEVVSITSTNAPDKRPDPKTDAGKATIRKDLDATETIFIDTIATGRGTTAANVRENFGRGAVVYAQDAIAKGMIDGMLEAQTQSTQPAQSGKTKTEAIKMDLNELQAKYPDLCAQAASAGVATAVKAEQERVEAHLVLGEASGDMETTLAAIKSGEGVTALVTAKHNAAAMKATAASARKDDEENLDSGDAQTAATKTADSLEDQTFAATAELMDNDGDFF